MDEASDRGTSNFAKFRYGDVFSGISLGLRSCWPQKLINPTALLPSHLRVLRAQYLGIDSVGGRYNDGVSNAVLALHILFA